MKRMHVMLKVGNLDESLRFYRQLFAAEPTVIKTDYAKWMLEDPPVNFSIGTVRRQAIGIEHLGIQAESPAELAELRARIGGLAAEGADVVDEGETTCCYARSDKIWVTDAQGVSWEAFYTHGPADNYTAPSSEDRSADCCGPDCCAGEAPDRAEAAGAA